MKQCGQAHGLEHVEVIVAGRSVRAKSNRDAGRQELGHRRDAAGELHIAFGVVRHRHVVAAKQLDVRGVHPHAVR